MRFASRQAILIGNTGFLGKALELQIGSPQVPHVSLTVADHRGLVRSILQSPVAKTAIESMLDSPLPQDWIFAAGLVDQNRDLAELERINVEAPLRLLQCLSDSASKTERRLITFGSVLENRPDIAAVNPYLRSKARLLEAWKLRSQHSPVKWIHIQLHTLYGGTNPPHPFMFTGQMLAALRSKANFRMSSGMQLREYHHLADITRSIVSLLDAQRETAIPLALSSGDPVRLRDLACAVFNHFDASDLLTIGARPVADAEVYESAHERSSHLIAYRNPYAGVIDWFESLGVWSGKR